MLRQLLFLFVFIATPFTYSFAEIKEELCSYIPNNISFYRFNFYEALLSYHCNPIDNPPKGFVYLKYEESTHLYYFVFYSEKELNVFNNHATYRKDINLNTDHCKSVLNDDKEINNKEYTVIDGRIFQGRIGNYIATGNNVAYIEYDDCNNNLILCFNKKQLLSLDSAKYSVESLWFEQKTNGSVTPSCIVVDNNNLKGQIFIDDVESTFLHILTFGREYYRKMIYSPFDSNLSVLLTTQNNKQRLAGLGFPENIDYNSIRNVCFHNNGESLFFIGDQDKFQGVYKYDIKNRRLKTLHIADQIKRIDFHPEIGTISIVIVDNSGKEMLLLNAESECPIQYGPFLNVRKIMYSPSGTHHAFIAQREDTSRILFIDGIQQKTVFSNIYDPREEPKFINEKLLFGYVDNIKSDKKYSEVLVINNKRIAIATPLNTFWGKDALNDTFFCFSLIYDDYPTDNWTGKAYWRGKEYTLNNFINVNSNQNNKSVTFIGNIEDQNNGQVYIYRSDGTRYGPFAYVFNLCIGANNECFACVVLANGKHALFLDGVIFNQYDNILEIFGLPNDSHSLCTYGIKNGMWYKINVNFESK